MNDDEELQDGEEPEPKIGLVEGLLVGIIIFLLGWLDVVPILGALPDVALGQTYLKFKRLSQYAWILLIGSILDVIPVLGPFIVTIAFLIVWYLDHHPQTAATVSAVAAATGVEQVAQAAAKIEGGELAEGAAIGGSAVATASSRTVSAMETAKETVGTANNIRQGAGAFRGNNDEENPQASYDDEQLSPEEASQQSQQRDMANFFRQGADITPAEEASEAAFNPKELQFSEAPSPVEKRRVEDIRNIPEEEAA